MEKYLIRDWRCCDNAILVELSDKEISVLSHFLNWAELTETFSIVNIGDVSHANWHDEYSVVERE